MQANENLKKIMAAMKRTPEANGEYMAKEVSNLALVWGNWVGSEGTIDYFMMKPNMDKLQIFNNWLETYLKDRFPAAYSEIEESVENK